MERLKYAIAWLSLNIGNLCSKAIFYGVPIGLAVGLLYYIIFKPWVFLSVLVIFILALGMAWGLNRFNAWLTKMTDSFMEWAQATVDKENAKDD